MAAMILRFHEAKEANAESVTCWGTGKPMREFLHLDDLGEACVHTLEICNPEPADTVQHLNVGTGVDLHIKELAEIVAETVGYKGEILCDISRPDETPKKLLDVNRIRAQGWASTIELKDGIANTYPDFLYHVTRR